MQKNRRVAIICAVLGVCLQSVISADGVAQTDSAKARWPHTLTVNGARVVVYQPQATEWPDHETLITREAIAVTPEGDKVPILGTTEMSFSTKTDAATGNVILSNPHLRTSRFPSLNTDRAAQMEDRIKRALPKIDLRPVPLQAILLSLQRDAKPDNAPVNNDPPAIFYSPHPASLVVFDGNPVLAPVGKSGLSFAVNTNWDVFSDGREWFLLNNGTWMAAPAYAGPYQRVTKLPPAFSSIPADANFATVRKAIPPSTAVPTPIPQIFVSTRPAEMIVTNGEPQFTPVPGTSLEAVKNTNAALFLVPASGTFYLLASGRWFSAHGLDGPWTFASGSLPPDFALIPTDSPEAGVLASVPGTAQAQLAVLQAQVPRQTTLKMTSAKPAVSYAGSPQFRPLPGMPAGASLEYAVNTPFEVIETGGRYYVCYQGAWFVGPSPKGPWVLATSVPQAIYAIPPSSPLYNVTYVKVYDATPAAVTYGYTSGYMMGFVSAGLLVYGTGYYYPPVVIPGRVPVYYPYPYSYVGAVAYNPNTDAWTRSGAVYGPYGGVATGGSYYNPSTGAYGRGGSIYGPNGGVSGVSYYNPSTGGYARGTASWNASGGSAQGSYYNPRTGVTGSTNQNWNDNSRTGSSTFAGPNQTVHTQSGSNARGSAGGFQSSTGAEGAAYRGAGGNSGGAVKTQSGDVYAGHDGNAYQHTSDGWSKWSNGGWQPVNPPSGATGQANRTSDTANRQQTMQSNRSETGTSSPYSRAGDNQAGARQTMDRSSYDQLERDRQARFSGDQQRFGAGGFGGGRFGGGGFGGGGHFRR